MQRSAPISPALPQPTLTTQMKSVGEVMAIGRTFQESFQKVGGQGGLPAARRKRRPQNLGQRGPSQRKSSQDGASALRLVGISSICLKHAQPSSQPYCAAPTPPPSRRPCAAWRRAWTAGACRATGSG